MNIPTTNPPAEPDSVPARAVAAAGSPGKSAPTVDCPCCGFALALPVSVGPRDRCACGHCGLVLRNGPALAAFRWSDQEAFVRRHGTSRANLWGGALGALAWLPALALGLVFSGGFDGWLFAALAVPWLALLLLLKGRRSGTPPLRWMLLLWAGLGLYLLYLWLLALLAPGWVGVVLPAAGGSATLLVGLGGTWTVLGLVGLFFAARRSQSLPQAFGTPPER